MRPKTAPNRHTTSGKRNLTGWAVAFLLFIAAGTATAQSYNTEKFACEVARNSELNCPKSLNGVVISGYGICYRYEPVAPTPNTKKKAKRSKKKDVVNLCFPPEELQGFIRE